MQPFSSHHVIFGGDILRLSGGGMIFYQGPSLTPTRQTGDEALRSAIQASKGNRLVTSAFFTNWKRERILPYQRERTALLNNLCPSLRHPGFANIARATPIPAAPAKTGMKREVAVGSLNPLCVVEVTTSRYATVCTTLPPLPVTRTQ